MCEQFGHAGVVFSNACSFAWYKIYVKKTRLKLVIFTVLVMSKRVFRRLNIFMFTLRTVLKQTVRNNNNNNNYGLQNHRLIKPLRFARLCCRMVEFYWFVPPVFIQFIFECVNINSVYDLSREVVPCFCYPEVKGVVLDTPHSAIRFW